jgi:hypothetical protein
MSEGGPAKSHGVLAVDLLRRAMKVRTDDGGNGRRKDGEEAD